MANLINKVKICNKTKYFPFLINFDIEKSLEKLSENRRNSSLSEIVQYLKNPF